MSTALPVPVRYLAIDVDNCLVPYETNYVSYVTNAIIDTVLELDARERNLFQGNRDTVAQLAQQYFETYGQSILGFALEHHLSVAEMNLYHDRLDPKEFINPTQEHMDQLRSFADWLVKARAENKIDGYMAFTQSTLPYAKRVLQDLLGLKQVFSDQLILSSDKFGNRFKIRDAQPYADFKLAMNIVDNRSALVIDDSKSVLRCAFETAKMQTCLVSHGAPVEENHMPYIGAVAQNIAEVPSIVTRLSTNSPP